MAHTITFRDTERDKELIRLIDKYQKSHHLSSRADAVRELCDIALKLKEIVNK